MKKAVAAWLAVASMGISSLWADVTLSGLFSDHAVLQRESPVKIWGWADPAEKVSVEFVGQTQSTQADKDGKWSVSFPSQKAGGPHVMKVKGKNELQLQDILFGEVWLCSGQSNMGWSVSRSVNFDLVKLRSNDSQLRLVTVSNPGSQETQKNIKGSWAVASADTVQSFSAVGYHFGRELREVLNVPVGLINNAWGGSACEAWVPRDVLEADDRYAEYLKTFKEKVDKYDHEALTKSYQTKFEKWKQQAKEARSQGKAVPRAPRRPQDPRFGQHRPANLYHGRIEPVLGYGIKGAIWYQGENNTNSDRSYDYRYLLPLMVKTWREKWGIGDFSFYWSQLADFQQGRDYEGISPWAELRESMTVATHTLKNSGQAVIIDLGEDYDIHPREKEEVARRLVRHALAKDYGYDIVAHSPEYKSHSIQGNKITLEFYHVETGFRPFDVRELLGFTIAGEDKKFIPAQAKLQGKKIVVWSDEVSDPKAVRYAWAGNPVCNVYNGVDLPLTPFRTDTWTLGSQKKD